MGQGIVLLASAVPFRQVPTYVIHTYIPTSETPVTMHGQNENCHYNHEIIILISILYHV